MVAEMARDLRWSAAHPVPSAGAARDIIRLLAEDGAVLPRLPPDASRARTASGV